MGSDVDPPRDGGPAQPELPDGDEERLLSDAEQTISDGEQTLADIDQTASDQDRGFSDLDQVSADIDQHASDRDQATADRDATAREEPGPWAAARYAASRADRLSTTLARHATSLDRMRIVAARDDVADRRDRAADARDEAAAARDRIAALREEELVVEGMPAAAVDALAAARIRAAEDRQRAARDRQAAAADRARAARDRHLAREALRHAHHDDLTGAMRRDLGEIALQQEIDRARRGEYPLSLTFIDVDGLKVLNDTSGHAAGDALLVCVVTTMRRHLRSFDTVVRYGGDEFLCAMPDARAADAGHRFGTITSAIAVTCGQGISIGVAELRDGDGIAELIARADAALYDARDIRDARD